MTNPLTIQRDKNAETFNALLCGLPSWMPPDIVGAIKFLGPNGIAILTGHYQSEQRQTFLALMAGLDSEFSIYKMLKD